MTHSYVHYMKGLRFSLQRHSQLGSCSFCFWISSFASWLSLYPPPAEGRHCCIQGSSLPHALSPCIGSIYDLDIRPLCGPVFCIVCIVCWPCSPLPHALPDDSYITFSSVLDRLCVLGVVLYERTMVCSLLGLKTA